MAKKRPKLADQIRSLRAERGMTQEELAEKADLPFSSLRNLEYRNINPKLETVIQVAKGLGVSLDELVFGKSKR